MTRTDKSFSQIDSVGKNFIKKYPEFKVKKRKAGPVAINARRLVYEDANHNLRVATLHHPFVHGALQGPNGWAAHQEGYIVKQGPTRLITQSSLEVGPIKIAEDGRICNFIKNISTGRVIQVLTAGLTAEVVEAGNDEFLTVVSDDPLDVTQTAKVYYVETTSGDFNIETAALNGTTRVAFSALLCNKLIGVELDASCAGTVKIENGTTFTDLATLTTGQLTKGIKDITAADTWKCYDRKFTTLLSALEAVNIGFEGYDLEGNIQREIITFKAANECLLKETVNRYSRITRMLVGDLTANYTLSGMNPNVLVAGLTNNATNITSAINDPGDIAGDGTMSVESDAAGDTTQSVTAFFANAAGTVFVETKALNGTTKVDFTGTHDTCFGAYLDLATTGSITITYDEGGGDDEDKLVWDGAVNLSSGFLKQEDGDLVTGTGLDFAGNNGPVTITCSNAAAVDIVLVVGEDIDGTVAYEILTLIAGTLATTASWSRITGVACTTSADTEYFSLSNATADLDYKMLGHAFEPSDAQDTEVECELY